MKLACRREAAIRQLERLRWQRAEAVAAGKVSEEQELEEIISAAWIDPQADRRALIETLVATQFTGDCWAPYPHEGCIRGTWWEVRTAYYAGMLTREEWQEIQMRRQAFLPHPEVVKGLGNSEAWTGPPEGWVPGQAQP